MNATKQRPDSAQKIPADGVAEISPRRPEHRKDFTSNANSPMAAVHGDVESGNSAISPLLTAAEAYRARGYKVLPLGEPDGSKDDAPKACKLKTWQTK